MIIWGCNITGTTNSNSEHKKETKQINLKPPEVNNRRWRNVDTSRLPTRNTLLEPPINYKPNLSQNSVHFTLKLFLTWCFSIISALHRLPFLKSFEQRSVNFSGWKINFKLVCRSITVNRSQVIWYGLICWCIFIVLLRCFRAGMQAVLIDFEKEYGWLCFGSTQGGISSMTLSFS